MSAPQVEIRERTSSIGSRMLVAVAAGHVSVVAVQFPETSSRPEEWRIVPNDLPQASVNNEDDARAWLEFIARNTAAGAS